MIYISDRDLKENGGKIANLLFKLLRRGGGHFSTLEFTS